MAACRVLDEPIRLTVPGGTDEVATLLLGL
jgi:hypothetical protein